jgi:hypothetical protein
MNSDDVLAMIRQRQADKDAQLTALDQAENNIKYLNTYNIKEVITNRNLCANEHKQIGSLPSAPLGESLRSGENESSVQPARKPKLIMNTPDINYAKVSVQKPSKENSRRRKINLDINVKNNGEIKKLTFASTDKLDEYLRDIKRDYEADNITQDEYDWYVDKAEFFKKLKADSGYRPIIGKGNRRGEKNTIRFTTAVFSGEHVYVWLGDWHNKFELETPNGPRAQKYTDFIGEYRDTRKPYVDMDWS